MSQDGRGQMESVLDDDKSNFKTKSGEDSSDGNNKHIPLSSATKGDDSGDVEDRLLGGGGDGGDGGAVEGSAQPEEDDGLPIDHGWAWVVLAGSVLNVFMMVGYGKAIAIFFVAYLKEFEASAATTTLFMGVMAGTFSLSSLFSMNVILQLIGERKTVIIGGTIAVIGMLTAVFATSITYLICTHSILIGIGHSMIHGPALVLIGKYFKKRRAIATAVAMSGISLGGSVFPPLANFLLNEYGVRGSMLILTGLTMNVWVGAALFRPLSYFQKKAAKNRSVMNKEHGDGDDDVAKDSSVKMAVDDSGGNNAGLCDSQMDTDKEKVVNKRNRPDSAISFGSQIDEHSECQLRMYKSNPDLTSMSLVDIREVHPQYADDQQETRLHKSACMHVKQAFAAFDFSLFKQPMFQLIAAFSHFGIVFTLAGAYLPVLANEKGIPPTEAAFLLTIAGVLDFCGRLALGFVADLKYIKINHLMAIGIVISGTVAQFASFYNTYALFIVFSVLAGIFGSFYNCLIPIAIVEFMGLKHMAKVLGFISVFHGLAMCLTHPIMGAIRDLTGSYNLCFNYIGICNYICAILLLCIPLVTKKTPTTPKAKELEEGQPLKND
ncbi:monocarboxylate transporter 3-like [Haliotis rufescens]|uniref:monocarboxylate transporter 3-like n=1 Tax=Haliotis rufescens TaxID=6454 RepID=UPI00201F4D1A|nr:monocarboxylate transporter 3-like [Haliotis rufescens]XP_048247428.1 monocarboxylate transporter 3-like [Haliotis rufescens]